MCMCVGHVRVPRQAGAGRVPGLREAPEAQGAHAERDVRPWAHDNNSSSSSTTITTNNNNNNE